MDQQPVGAEGNSLGAIGVVQLQVKVENTGVHRQVRFYVLDTSKPIWSGELANCGIILGNNALDNLGFHISLPDGSTVAPESTMSGVNGTAGCKKSKTDQVGTERKPEAPVSHTSKMLNVSLMNDVHLGLRQTRLASPYASGSVLMRKKDGGLHICVDYRSINRNTVPDCYPLPN